jgi:predicted aminopeptidase
LKALAVLWLFSGSVLPGCYYGHLAVGQARLLLGSEPVESLLADPETPPELAARLARVQEVIAFAAGLGLEVDGQYTSYVAWPGDRVITTVVATLPGQISPSNFWFPLVGHAPYKGFFDPERAAREADSLEQDGFDTCLVPVLAYSTLGWFDDPLTGPMLRQSEGRLAETVLHELVHATVFVPSQPDFNEGLAAFIGQEAAVRFAHAREPAGDCATHERQRVAEDRQVAAALERFRHQVAELYGREAGKDEREEGRAALEAAARAELAALPLTTRDPALLAQAVRLSDACQALSATYQADLPRWEAALEAIDGELPALIRRAREAANADDPRAALLGPEPASP